MTAVQMKMSIQGTPPEEGQGITGTMVPAQNYDKIRRNCLQKKTLFEDPYFPANEKSLFFSQKLPFNPVWKRPFEIVKDPKLFTDGASRFDVEQGMLGDCWLVAAIASVSQDNRLWYKVIPKDQSFQKGYAGIFKFKFWHFGEWVDIVIDDRLPTHNGKLIFIHSSDENEFWSALLEKAYAKLYGGFESLKGGKTSEAMTDFTGGVVEHFEMKNLPEDIFSQMHRSSKRSSLMSCSIKAAGRKDVEAKLDSGLIKGHAYSITGVATVTTAGHETKLVRVRNPWGQKEWNGDWSDNSPIWHSVSADERKKLDLESKDDGEFWMSFDDFKKHFTDIELCAVSIDELYEDDSIKSWSSVVINGGWDADIGTAGGCRNFPTFVKNPQYVIDLKEDADGDGKCSILVALMQKHRRKQKKMGVQDLCIGYSIYKAPSDGSDITKQYVDYNLSTATSGSFTNAREVMKRFDLEPGKYIIIPCAFKPGEEGDFLLRIFSESISEEKTTSDSSSVGNGESKLKIMFSHIAGADGEIDAEELQDMMTAAFSINSEKAIFSLDACKALISSVDTNKNGTLNFEEFSDLLATINKWKKLYIKFDRDRSESLEKRELYECIRSLGYSLPADCFNLLMNRFATRRRYLTISDFIHCMARIKMMDDAFKKHSSNNDKIVLSKEAFFMIAFNA